MNRRNFFKWLAAGVAALKVTSSSQPAEPTRQEMTDCLTEELNKREWHYSDAVDHRDLNKIFKDAYLDTAVKNIRSGGKWP